MRWIAFVSLMLSLSAQARTVCQGQVDIPSWQSGSTVQLSFDGLDLGAQFDLWNSVTGDDERYIPLQVMKSMPNGTAVSVEAEYEREPISHLSFTWTGDQLVDFQGVEGGVAFGPNTLRCQ